MKWIFIFLFVVLAVCSINAAVRVMLMCNRFIDYLNSATEVDQYALKLMKEEQNDK